MPIDDIQCCLSLGRRCKVLEAILGDQDIVFNSHASDWVIILQEFCVDVFGVFRILEIDFFECIAREITVL